MTAARPWLNGLGWDVDTEWGEAHVVLRPDGRMDVGVPIAPAADEPRVKHLVVATATDPQAAVMQCLLCGDVETVDWYYATEEQRRFLRAES